MDTPQLLAGLADPAAYPHPVDCVAVRQTHISLVFLAGPFAYKVKKPVRLGFLDFSTPDRRRHFCREEVRLNARLAPHVYLGVVPVVATAGGRPAVDAPGEPVDWAVKMVRLPDDGSFLARLGRGDLTADHLTRLARLLAEFHRTAAGGPDVAAFGRFEVVAGNARENFDQSAAHVGVTVRRPVFDRLRALTDAALDRLRPLIEDRAAHGATRDTHGDLRLDHVYLRDDGTPFAIDCVEFADRFRYADPVADVAFLVMDLSFHGRPDLGRALADAYFAAAGSDGRPLLPFYAAYRAVVRAKVDGVELAEPEVPADAKAAAAVRARAHWLLALGELEEPGRRPALALVGGLPGTGKSTLARGLAAAGGFDVIRSDVVRKELAGVPANEPAAAEHYASEWTDRTYAECLRRAEDLLLDGRRVVVDATFREEARRREAVDLGRRLCVPAVLFVCEADPAAVRARLAARTGDASDADWEVYEQAAASWEAAGAEVTARLVTIPTDAAEDPVGRAAAELRGRGLLGGPAG